MGGHMGKVAWVDLSTGKMEVEELAEKVRRKYLGGTALAAYLMRRFRFREIDPLGPENVLIFAAGPLTGANVPTSGRYAVAAKSPATGIWGEADSGGRLGIAIKSAGFDAIAITGKAPAPSVLCLINGEASIVPADAVWGKDTVETFDILTEKYGKKAAIACIGPAGERKVPLAGIIAKARMRAPPDAVAWAQSWDRKT